MATIARIVRNHILIAAVLVIVPLVHAACGSKKDVSSNDLEAINALHQRDIEATKKWDVDGMESLWTDDIVSLSPGEPPLIGKAANRASIMRLRDETRDVRVIDYIVSINEVKVSGDWAFEWGTYSGSIGPVAGGESLRSTGKLIRVLKKEPDGSWKIARTMFNSDDEPE